jgi:hypothetical protein
MRVLHRHAAGDEGVDHHRGDAALAGVGVLVEVIPPALLLVGEHVALELLDRAIDVVVGDLRRGGPDDERHDECYCGQESVQHVQPFPGRGRLEDGESQPANGRNCSTGDSSRKRPSASMRHGSGPEKSLAGAGPIPRRG